MAINNGAKNNGQLIYSRKLPLRRGILAVSSFLILLLINSLISIIVTSLSNR